MKKLGKFISALLCFIMIFSLCSCSFGENYVKLTPPSNTGFWKEKKDAPSNDESENIWDKELKPNVNITIIGEDDKKDEEIKDEIDDGEINNVYALIQSAVIKDLEEEGFECGIGIASTMENDNYSGMGIYYSNPEFEMFESESNLKSVGFVEIVSSTENSINLDKEESMIFVKDINDLSNPTKSDEENYKICVYNYENIGSYHFVYNNKYVQYYQETPTKIVYNTFENKKENYDLSWGSIYDYDNNKYIYDESILGEYKNHSAIELFKEEDYLKLENELKEVSEQQIKNGYEVLEFNLIYISPESIQAYLSSEEEETFFGYNVDELTQAFGLGSALVFNGSSFEKAQILTTEENYNWKSFLIKMGVGCGIMLVGAILSPVTGGASFSCALVTISKVAVTYALSSAIGTIAIKSVEGLIEGKSVEDAIKSVTYSGLDSFANGFIIGAAIGSAGLLTGVIKPKACFVAGTAIATELGYKSIENIAIGDKVLSYNEETGQVSYQKVTDLFSKEVNQTISLIIDGKLIETTYNHPFWSPKYNGWIQAGELNIDDYVIDSNGKLKVINNKIVNHYLNPVMVYNFTVDNNHTYYVGEDKILVHNECTKLQSKRNKAVKEAWKNEKQAVLNGTSKYKWTPSQKAELIKNGSIKGYEGAHLIDVQKLVGTANEKLISDPNNIVFLSHSQHLAAHGGCYKNATNIKVVVKFVPWATKQLASILAW